MAILSIKVKGHPLCESRCPFEFLGFGPWRGYVSRALDFRWSCGDPVAFLKDVVLRQRAGG